MIKNTPRALALGFLTNVKFLQGDGTNLKFKNSSFDYVIETNSFHHLDFKTAIKEVYRVLKKNGSFYLMDISKYFFIWPLGLFFPAESYFTKNEFIKQLESDGFKIENTKGNLSFFIVARKV